MKFLYRAAIEYLKQWKEKKKRKPLLIRGARQVGKTWLMNEFGRSFYAHTVYINFDNNPPMKELFSADMQIERIITGLEIYAGHKIDPDQTLLIFDEIQEVPEALASLKYFNENAPGYQIVCAGSLLGAALHQGTSFPVGKVEFLDLYPLSFAEFLYAMDQKPLADLLKKHDFKLASAFSQNYIDLLKYYYFVGGMPECVEYFSANKDFNEVRNIQKNILLAYEQDFSKHAPNHIVPRIRMLWNSLPAQLSKENKKFIYGLIREGARAKDYEMALLWLRDCGLVHPVHRVTAPGIPLSAYEDTKAFKLFFLDIGLLSCMAHLDQSVLIDGSQLFREFKGGLTEQYVLQQLKTLRGIDTWYWTNGRGTAEIDFLIQSGPFIIPLEVKAEANLKAKSLKIYCEKFAPPMAVRLSMAGYKQEDKLLNLPLWAAETLQHIDPKTEDR